MPMTSLSRAVSNRAIQDSVRRTMARSSAFGVALEPNHRILAALEELERMEAVSKAAANANRA